MISKCYVETNNKFSKSYNPNKPNNLYGESMMQFLPFEILDLADPKNYCGFYNFCFLEMYFYYFDEFH